jgi:hypothetical protein
LQTIVIEPADMKMPPFNKNDRFQLLAYTTRNRKVPLLLKKLDSRSKVGGMKATLLPKLLPFANHALVIASTKVFLVRKAMGESV